MDQIVGAIQLFGLPRLVMPALLFSHAPFQEAVTFMLQSPDHVDNLYPADDVMVVLNIEADVADGAIIDVMVLLRFFLPKIPRTSLSYSKISL